MNYEITSKLRGKCLVTKENVGPIPTNTLVFCFEEDKDYFRVYTREDYLGMREFKLSQKLKNKFIICD